MLSVDATKCWVRCIVWLDRKLLFLLLRFDDPAGLCCVFLGNLQPDSATGRDENIRCVLRGRLIRDKRRNV